MPITINTIFIVLFIFYPLSLTIILIDKAQWRRLSVCCSTLLAICLKSFVKHDMAFRDVPVK
jgi:hypothetical protein